MKTQINEIKRMQLLAGIITESQLNEGIMDLSQAAVDLLMDKTKYATKPGSTPGVFTVYDLSRPKGAASFGDDMASQKVGFLWTPESKYKAYKLESDDENTVKKLMALKENLNEAELSSNEQELVDAVMGDVNEAIDLGKILKKVKALASKGLLTVAMASTILASCGTAGSSDEMFKRELENLKKVDSIENVQKARIDSISQAIKSNPTTATIK